MYLHMIQAGVERFIFLTLPPKSWSNSHACLCGAGDHRMLDNQSTECATVSLHLSGHAPGTKS